uniref:Uncharacterized protein n=1 Tax=Gopherus agassizii TaxID=38772 RepID=A0A452I8N0_9SAUR
MDAAHRAALLTASCLRTPVNPRTRAPLALYERERRPPAAAEHQDEFDLDCNTERQQSPTLSGDCEDWIDFPKMCHSNQEYYLKLEELKNAHLETMAKLENMYQNKLHLKGVQPLDNKDAAPSLCYRNHEKQRMQEYLREREEMEERVKQRPLLLERATQKNARIAAEKHYSDILRELGICEDFLSKKRQTAKLLDQSNAKGFGSCTEDRESLNEDKVQERESCDGKKAHPHYDLSCGEAEEEKASLESDQSCEEEEEEKASSESDQSCEEEEEEEASSESHQSCEEEEEEKASSQSDHDDEGVVECGEDKYEDGLEEKLSNAEAN